MRTGQLICTFLVFSFAYQQVDSKTWIAKVLKNGIGKIKHIKNVGGAQKTVADTVQDIALVGARKTVDKVDDVLQPSIIKVNPKNILKADDVIPDEVIPKVINKGQNIDASDIKKIKAASGASADDVKISSNTKTGVNKGNPAKDGPLASNSKPDIANKVNGVPEADLVSGPKLSLLDKAKKQITPDLMTNGLVQPSVVKKVNPKEIVKEVVNKANPAKDGTLAAGPKIDMTKLKELGKTHQIQQIDPKFVIKEEAVLPKDIVGRHSHRWFDKFYGGRTKDGVSLSNTMGNAQKPQNLDVARVKAQHVNMDSSINIAKIKPQNPKVNSDVIKSQNGVPNKNLNPNVNQPKQGNIGGPEQPHSVRGVAYADEAVNKGKKVSSSISSSNDGGANAAKAGIQADQSVPKYSDMRNTGVAIDQADYANKKNVLLTSGVTVGQATYPWLTTTITHWGKQLKEHIEAALPWVISGGIIIGSFILALCVFWIKNQCCCCCFKKKSVPNVSAGKLEITLKGLPAESTTVDKKKDKMIPVPKTLIKKEENSMMRGKSNKQLVEFYSNYTIDRPSTPKCLSGVKTNEFMI